MLYSANADYLKSWLMQNNRLKLKPQRYPVEYVYASTYEQPFHVNVNFSILTMSYDWDYIIIFYLWTRNKA